VSGKAAQQQHDWGQRESHPRKKGNSLIYSKQVLPRIKVLVKILATPKRVRTICSSLCLVVFAFAVPISIMADTVSGRIYCQDGKPVSNVTFTAKPTKGDAVAFKTDSSGNFSVYLDPGRYTVTPAGDGSLQGLINSYPQPVQRDVRLVRGGK
jgi:hypothetical protein